MSPDGIGPKQMDRQVDVLVVGAGPTGSTAAKYAALYEDCKAQRVDRRVA